MEMFPIYSAQKSRHQSHVAIESLQSDYGKWGPDRFLILFHVINLNLNGNMQPVATTLSGRTGLEICVLERIRQKIVGPEMPGKAWDLMAHGGAASAHNECWGLGHCDLCPLPHMVPKCWQPVPEPPGMRLKYYFLRNVTIPQESTYKYWLWGLPN